MQDQTPSLFFDYVDPLSYLLDHALRELGDAVIDGHRIERIPFELQPPPDPLLDPTTGEWARRWAEAKRAAVDLGLDLEELPLVPWTRKAHELVLHAAQHGKGDEVHRAVFRGVFEEGRDIGRIDLLVGIARDSGLDPVEASTVLGVDKFAAAVEASRSMALSLGVVAPPTLVAHGQLLQGFHNRDDLRTFLCPP